MSEKILKVSELRKQLKPLGFTVKTKQLSFGTSGTIVRVSDKEVMPSIFCGSEHRQEWISAIDAIRGIKVVTSDGERVSGPWS